MNTHIGLDVLRHKLESFLNPLGFEAHPFLIGWYNNKVNDKFNLNYPRNICSRQFIPEFLIILLDGLRKSILYLKVTGR